jgi:hypothetical protein
VPTCASPVRNPGISITGSERGAGGGSRNTSLRSNAPSSIPSRPSRQIGVRGIDPTLTAANIISGASDRVFRLTLRPRTVLASFSLRAMFITYFVMIVSGIVLFSVIGITHH